MTTDHDTKSSSESSGDWWCLPLPSVRDKQASHQDSNSAGSPPADSSEKKRKRKSPNFGGSPKKATTMANNVKKTELEIVNDYRQELVEGEQRKAWDYPASVDNLAPMEKAAAAIVRHLREFERKYVFGNRPSEDLPGPNTLDMGGQFLTNKQRIETQSELYKIAKEVPKGALLHLHFNAELNPESLLLEARSMENMYVWSIQPLINEEALGNTEMIFKILPLSTVSVDIFSKDYKGKKCLGKNNKVLDNWRHEEFQNEVWMRWNDFREGFEDNFPMLYKQTDKQKDDLDRNRVESQPAIPLGPAENWILQKMVLSPEEAYKPEQTVNGVWARFNQATRCFKGLLNYEKVYKWYISQAIDRMIDEKVMYAELRPMLLDKFIPDNDGNDGPEKGVGLRGQMELIRDGVREKKRQLEENKEKHLFPFGLKIIYCTPRSIPESLMRKEIDDCIKLAEEFPDLICGFDLVGAEDRPNHIGFYNEQLTAFQQQCREKNLKLPFLFHAGETLLDTGGSKEPTNSNLYDAVALRSKRIGHGFSLLKHPYLIEKFRRTPMRDEKDNIIGWKPGTGICIELCPISNELLHLCRNIKEHPYPELLAAGIPCCVNSDNPSLFSNSMSHEFYQIMVGAPTMSVHSWKQLAIWSLEYSCLKEHQQEEALGYFKDAWKDFCKKVVDDYGDMFEFDDNTVKSFNVVKAAEKYKLELDKGDDKPWT